MTQNICTSVFVGRLYRIHRQTGRVQGSEDGFCHSTDGTFDEAMSIYDLLCCSKEGCFACPASLGPCGVPLPGPWRGAFHAPCGKIQGKSQALRQACQALGGVEAGKGDVAYCLPVFDCLPVRLAFWEADEDFPPSLQFQWDRNTTDFIHFETTFYVTSHLLGRLLELMGEAR